jgi:hypothetical protein
MERLLICPLLIIILAFLNTKPVSAQITKEWDVLQPNRCVKDVPLKGPLDIVTDTVEDVPTIQGLECLFINIVRIITPLAGLALFIMLIIGSLQLLTSGGDAKATQKAGQTITWAIVGLVLLLGIWFVLQLVKTITGVDVTKFVIPG